MSDTANRPPLLPLAEAALALGESPIATFHRCTRGELRAWRLGRGWGVARPDLDALLEARDARPAAPAAGAR